MNITNQKIINAIIEKAEKLCPDALSLIGIYGSVATGDDYEKSDLDLLILIDNDKGRCLGTGYILDNIKVGYDIYCTNWEGLKFDASLQHAKLAKLMDSKIVYVKNQKDYEKLLLLREQTKKLLSSNDRFVKVNELLNKAKVSFANAYLHENLGEVRLDSFEVISYLMDAVILFHGRYFKLGTKRMLEELSSLPIDKMFFEKIKSIAASKDVLEIRNFSRSILLYCDKNLIQNNEQQSVSPSSLCGVYEETYSNWRNKVEQAANSNDVFSSFMNMSSLHYMLGNFYPFKNDNIMEHYNPCFLDYNVKIFDSTLEKLEEIYKENCIEIKRFNSLDDFVIDYLK